MNKLVGVIKYFYTNYWVAPLLNFRGGYLVLNRNLYNKSWDNERTIELPLIQNTYNSLGINKFNKKEINILEIGNVLKNYEKKLKHDVIDKYEKGPRIKNIDFLDYKTPKKYDYIFSISTFEHIGFDYGEKQDATKPLKALRKVLTMLKPKGKAYITIPVGFNQSLDDEIIKGVKGYNLISFKRISNWGNKWIECPPKEAYKLKYNSKYPNANAIFVLFRDMKKHKLEIDSEELVLIASTLKQLQENVHGPEYKNVRRVLNYLLPKVGKLLDDEVKFVGGINESV
jgi:SAM-dependent methyltransferase